MGPVAIIAGVALAVGAGTAYMSHQAQKKQAKFMRKSAAAQRAQDNMKAARERREAIRSARIASGNVMQASVNQGTQSSSAALGGLGSISQQLNQGLSFLDGYNSLADQASRAETKANKAGVTAGAWASASGLAMQVFSSAGNLGGGK
jgi:imidazolonepropionase-like amidohydrolase